MNGNVTNKKGAHKKIETDDEIKKNFIQIKIKKQLCHVILLTIESIEPHLNPLNSLKTSSILSTVDYK